MLIKLFRNSITIILLGLLLLIRHLYLCLFFCSSNILEIQAFFEKSVDVNIECTIDISACFISVIQVLVCFLKAHRHKWLLGLNDGLLPQVVLARFFNLLQLHTQIVHDVLQMLIKIFSKFLINVLLHFPSHAPYLIIQYRYLLQIRCLQLIIIVFVFFSILLFMLLRLSLYDLFIIFFLMYSIYLVECLLVTIYFLFLLNLLLHLLVVVRSLFFMIIIIIHFLNQYLFLIAVIILIAVIVLVIAIFFIFVMILIHQLLFWFQLLKTVILDHFIVLLVATVPILPFFVFLFIEQCISLYSKAIQVLQTAKSSQ